MKDFIYIRVLKYDNGQYAGMDHDSGGYPYPANSVFSAYRWENRSDGDLRRYMKSFPQLKLHYLKITIEDE